MRGRQRLKSLVAPSGTTATVLPEVARAGHDGSRPAERCRRRARSPGVIVLRRESAVRRIPFWGRVAVPKLAAATQTLLAPARTPGTPAGGRRGSTPTATPRFREVGACHVAARRPRAGVPRARHGPRRELRRRRHATRPRLAGRAAHRHGRRREPPHGIPRASGQSQPVRRRVRRRDARRRRHPAQARDATRSSSTAPRAPPQGASRSGSG